MKRHLFPNLSSFLTKCFSLQTVLLSWIGMTVTRVIYLFMSTRALKNQKIKGEKVHLHFVLMQI